MSYLIERQTPCYITYNDLSLRIRTYSDTATTLTVSIMTPNNLSLRTVQTTSNRAESVTDLEIDGFPLSLTVTTDNTSLFCFGVAEIIGNGGQILQVIASDYLTNKNPLIMNRVVGSLDNPLLGKKSIKIGADSAVGDELEIEVETNTRYTV